MDNKKLTYSIKLDKELKDALSKIDNNQIIEALKDLVDLKYTNRKYCSICRNLYDIKCFENKANICANCILLANTKSKLSFKNLLYSDNDIIEFYNAVEDLRVKRKKNKSLPTIKEFIRQKMDYDNYRQRIKLLIAKKLI